MSFRGKSTALKKVLVTLLGLLGAPRSNSAPGYLCPLSPLVSPLEQTNIFRMHVLTTVSMQWRTQPKNLGGQNV